ncbi:MAG: YlbF family regulator [Clostridiales bacterium]|jgi:cell fate (sporulation/competence/biofilm development) regulator YlbF (YheA/YmcA/DUF963 family)|nr:YlbF family regulator [Clostridiales bacterium]
MSEIICFEKARELGQLILESQVSKDLSDAGAVFDADKEAKEKFAEYKNFYTSVQTKFQSGELSKEQAEEETKKLAEMGASLEKYDSINGIIEAEDEFNNFVGKIMNIIKSTVSGQVESDCNGSCSSCSGCGSK